MEEAVRLRIKRYSLNIGLGFENRLILVDEGYIGKMSKAVVERVKGELGIISKTGLFAGTREDELIYIYNTPICNNGSICDAERCKSLHLINKKNGMTIVVVNWLISEVTSEYICDKGCLETKGNRDYNFECLQFIWS